MPEESFEINRWHSAAYIESWMANRSADTGPRLSQKELVSFLPFDKGMNIRVLDLGTGTGMLSLQVLAVFPKAILVCHDFSDVMLDHARQQLAPFSDRVTFVKSDLREPSWPQVIQGAFDAVVSSFVMHTVPDNVKEIYRRVFGLVKPGGCFLVSDIYSPPGDVTRRIYLKQVILSRQAVVKAETGVEKSVEEIKQELLERRQSRHSGESGRLWEETRKSHTLVNNLEWLSQAGFTEVDCLSREVRRAILGGFKH